MVNEVARTLVKEVARTLTDWKADDARRPRQMAASTDAYGT
jgi:hypothetical protein